MVELDCCIAVVFLRQRFCQRTWPLLPVGATLGLRLNYEFPKAAGLFPFLSPEHHNYPNYYHHRNPRSPYDIDRSPVWYVQKLCHHYCELANHPPRFALSLHGVRRVGRFNALALLKSRDAFRSASLRSAPIRLAPIQVGTPQVSTDQLGTVQVGTHQVGIAQLGTVQVGTDQVRPNSIL
jgi:hypothetical protein